MVAGGTQQRFAVVIEQQAVNPDARDHSHLVEREQKASKGGNWNVDVYELLRELRSRSVRERCRERIELKDPVHGEESERERCSLTRHRAQPLGADSATEFVPTAHSRLKSSAFLTWSCRRSASSDSMAASAIAMEAG